MNHATGFLTSSFALLVVLFRLPFYSLGFCAFGNIIVIIAPANATTAKTLTAIATATAAARCN
jgi:hypothetical protein